MLTVTDAALEHLAGARNRLEESKPPNVCFRIVPMETNRLSLTVDTPKPEDTAYEHDGSTVLVLSQDVSGQCEGRTLDADGTGNSVVA